MDLWKKKDVSFYFSASNTEYNYFYQEGVPPARLCDLQLP